MKLLAGLAVTCLSLIGRLGADPAPATTVPVARVSIVPATDSLVGNVAPSGGWIRELLEAASPTIGTRYQWGGVNLEKGVDCSNYTWQLFRSIGRPYHQFLSTMALSRLKRSNGLKKVRFESAQPGDLLVYGYRDNARKWRGHVVILIDRDGSATGHAGLVLGAHGGDVGTVQFVTFGGFDDGYFSTPEMRLCNVLRVDEPSGTGAR